MVDEVLYPGVVGVARRWRAESPANIVLKQMTRPVRVIEERVRENVVGLKVRVEIAQEGVGGLQAQVGFNATDCEVHVSEAPGRRVRLLTEDRDAGLLPAVSFDKALGLHEHARRAAARVVHAPLVRFEHLHQQSYDAAGCKELAAALALGLGELAQEVLVHATEHIARPGALTLEPDAGDQVDQPLHLLGRDAPAGIIAWELPFQVRVVALDCKDGVVDEGSDVRARRLILQAGPTCFGWHPEDSLGGVLVAALQQQIELRATDSLSFQFASEFVAARLKRVGDVLQKEQAENNVLVLGSIDLPTQRVSSPPEFVGVVQIGGGCIIVCHVGFRSLLFRMPDSGKHG